MTKAEMKKEMALKSRKSLISMVEKIEPDREYSASELHCLIGDDFLSKRSVSAYLERNTVYCKSKEFYRGFRFENGKGESAVRPSAYNDKLHNEIKKRIRKATKTYVNVDNPLDVIEISKVEMAYTFR